MALKLLKLLPTEEKFYRLMAEMSVCANTGARLLQAIVTSEDADHVAVCGREISETKARAKKLYETLTVEVCRTFVTPFDREDIQAFGLTLYKVPKVVEKIQDRMLTHKLRPFNGDFNRMTDIILQEASVLERVIPLLNNGRKLKEISEQVALLHDLEDQADRTLGQLIADLFWSIQDTRELILRKDLYDMLEHVTDYYRDCGNLALQIILKHS